MAAFPLSFCLSVSIASGILIAFLSIIVDILDSSSVPRKLMFISIDAFFVYVAFGSV